MRYEILISKNNRKYLKVFIGDYEAFIFPSKAEIAYLESFTRDKAHEDFKNVESIFD